MPTRQPVILGVAGGTGSGKTTVARAILDSVGAERIAFLAHDSYYHDLDPTIDPATFNFDHPAAGKPRPRFEPAPADAQAQHISPPPGMEEEKRHDHRFHHERYRRDTRKARRPIVRQQINETPEQRHDERRQEDRPVRAGDECRDGIRPAAPAPILRRLMAARFRHALIHARSIAEDPENGKYAALQNKTPPCVPRMEAYL